MAGPYLNQGAFKTRVTDTHTTQQEELGILRFDGARILRYCKAGAALVGGNAVKLDDTTGTHVIATAASVDPVYGIAETAIASGSFGWITVFGKAFASVDSTATAAFDKLQPTATAGMLSRALVSSSTYGVALEAGQMTARTTAIHLNCL